MNIIDLQDNLKNLPENALMQEMQQPTGSAPPFLILGELKRRKQMRDDYNRQQNAGMKTVAEEVVTAAGAPQEGIMQMARSLNPNTNMAQDTGLAQAAPVTPTQAPQPQAPQMMSGGGILRMARGGRFGTDIEYNYKTFLQENNLNDTPYAQDMFARLKETMDDRYDADGPNNNPRIYDNAIGFERSPEGLASVSSEASDFMPSSGEFTRPESSLGRPLNRGLETMGLGNYYDVGRDYTPTSAELSAQLANANLLDLRQSQFDVDMSQTKTPNRTTENVLLESGIIRQEQAQKLADGKISQSEYDEAIAVLDNMDQEIRKNPFDRKDEDLEYDVKRAADRAFERRTEAGDFDGTILGEGEGGMPIPQTSPAEPLSILDQLRSSVYSSNPLEDALAGTGLDSNVIGTSVIDPIMNRIDEAASREGMPSQTAADLANEIALRNREMASENAGRLTAEELLAVSPESSSELLSGPFSNVPRFNPDSLQGAVDRDRELTPEERYTQRESSLLQDQMLGLGFTGGDIDPSPFSTVTADPSIDYSSLPISTLNKLADEGDDSAINQLRLNEITGLQTQSDISTGRDDLYMDSIMRGTLGQGRSDAAYAASLYNPSDISNAQDTITSLEEYLRLNPGNPQAEAQLAQARDQLIQAETAKETSIALALQDIVPSTTPRRSEFQVFDATAADVETVDAEDATGGEPNLVTQDPVGSTIESTTVQGDANRRAADSMFGTGITSIGGQRGTGTTTGTTTDDAGGSATSSGGAYGSIESRIAKMLSDRESSAEADKWMALAQTGMALMASKNPTFGGALGEAGLAGVGALQQSRKAYDSDIMSLLGMQQKIQSAKSLDASRAAKSTSGGSKELNIMIDNARADLALANAAAAKYFKVQSGDPLAGTEDRMINMIPPDVQANVIAAQDRLDALNRIAIGGGTQFDATQ